MVLVIMYSTKEDPHSTIEELFSYFVTIPFIIYMGVVSAIMVLFTVCVQRRVVCLRAARSRLAWGMIDGARYRE